MFYLFQDYPNGFELLPPIKTSVKTAEFNDPFGISNALHAPTCYKLVIAKRAEYFCDFKHCPRLVVELGVT